MVETANFSFLMAFSIALPSVQMTISIFISHFVV